VRVPEHADAWSTGPPGSRAGLDLIQSKGGSGPGDGGHLQHGRRYVRDRLAEDADRALATRRVSIDAWQAGEIIEGTGNVQMIVSTPGLITSVDQPAPIRVHPSGYRWGLKGTNGRGSDDAAQA
jgi:hypothetical protein